MKLRPMTESDVEFMANHSVSRGIFSKMPEEIDVSVTLEHDDKVLCVGGISMINCTTAWCWLDLSEESGKYIVIVYRLVKEWLDDVVEQKGIKRLQAYVEIGFEEAERTMHHLGFEWEFRMKNFVGDKPADLYVRFS